MTTDTWINETLYPDWGQRFRIADRIALGCRHLVTEAGQETSDSPNPAEHGLARMGF